MGNFDEFVGENIEDLRFPTDAFRRRKVAPLEVGVPTKMYVLNVLHRLLDGKAEPPPVDAPHALRLVTEPQANVDRYDALREERKVRHA